MRFICSQHPKRKGKSLDARLRTKSIGIPPLRLLCGRAASYGSIFNPCTCHRHLQEQLGFLLYKSCSLASFWKVLALLQPRLGSPHTRNVSNGMYIQLSICIGDFCPSLINWDRISKKLKKIFNYFKKIFSANKKAPNFFRLKENECKKISPPINR